MATVELKQLSKRYSNGYQAVHGINLKINDGEFMVFVGPSGCAKSTTLRMIAGLEEISDGEIYIGDRLVNNLPSKDRGIAMVFQNYALYPHMTVYENMAFGLKVAGIPKKEVDSRVREAAEKLEITELLHKKPKEMSGGQRQRVAVGRAIVRKPDVFLFDEPLSNLDAKLRVSMRIRISQLHKELQSSGQKATMIYVTHDQVEAMTMGDRICILNHGRIMQVDTPLAVYHHPKNKFVAGFIGSPAMNMLEGKLHWQNETLWFKGGNGIALILPESKAQFLRNQDNLPVWLGIRPEHIEVINNKDFAKNGVFNASVNLIEQMGHETYIHFQNGTDIFIARINHQSLTARHDTKELTFQFLLEHCHIFDKNSEENISLPQEDQL